MMDGYQIGTDYKPSEGWIVAVETIVPFGVSVILVWKGKEDG